LGFSLLGWTGLYVALVAESAPIQAAATAVAAGLTVTCLGSFAVLPHFGLLLDLSGSRHGPRVPGSGAGSGRGSIGPPYPPPPPPSVVLLIRSGDREGWRWATYAVPTGGVRDDRGREIGDTAVVFNRYYMGNSG
jgi:hypothetical protein